jgi:hypothetical protein
MSAPQVLWRPSPKQADFLAASEDEVLYGGAAGGGKSDGLLIDALGLAAGRDQHARLPGDSLSPDVHRAARPDRPLADDLRPELPGAKYNQTEHVWTWPSGAKIEFGHMHHPNDRFKYRGRQFAYDRVGRAHALPLGRRVRLPLLAPSVSGDATEVLRASHHEPGRAGADVGEGALGDRERRSGHLLRGDGQGRGSGQGVHEDAAVHPRDAWTTTRTCPEASTGSRC